MGFKLSRSTSAECTFIKERNRERESKVQAFGIQISEKVI